MRLEVLVAGLILTTVSVTQAQQLITELKVTERANAARRAEPITNGIPLPQGLVKDVDGLALHTANGVVLPAAFSVLNRWPTDGSVRWALLDTQVSLPAGGSLTLQLVQRAPAPARAGGGATLPSPSMGEGGPKGRVRVPPAPSPDPRTPTPLPRRHLDLRPPRPENGSLIQ